MTRALALLIAVGLISAGCSGEDGKAKPEPAPTTTTPTPSAPVTPSDKTPTVRSSTFVDNLEFPWDIAFLPDGSMLYTERDRERVTHRKTDGSSEVVLDEPAGMWHSGETGLESVEPAADFAQSNDFLTCHGYRKGNTQDVRVVRWHLDGGKASFVRNLITGLPSTSGRHGGCALEHGADDALHVGTGDAADGRNPRNLSSGGGKVLRVDDKTGNGLPDNPFADSGNAMRRRVWSYGHRNIQGLALRESDESVWSVEHGPDRDDEVNRSVKGGDFGWNPVPGYNESVPMTDHSLPGEQFDAAWTSGGQTLATSGGTFLRGNGWGKWAGGLAVASLKDQSLHILMFDEAGKLTEDIDVKDLHGKFGRLRATVVGPDGSLYLTTSNGDDKIVKVTPG
ncbi:MAG: PQQ-dependent sugar dehydrogenase [Aeromicrobium sp.]